MKCIGLKAVENADSWVAFDERKDLCDVQDFGVKFKFGPDSMKIKKSNSFNKGLSWFFPYLCTLRGHIVSISSRKTREICWKCCALSRNQWPPSLIIHLMGYPYRTVQLPPMHPCQRWRTPDDWFLHQSSKFEGNIIQINPWLIMIARVAIYQKCTCFHLVTDRLLIGFISICKRKVRQQHGTHLIWILAYPPE